MKYFYFSLFSFFISLPIFSQCTGDIYLETKADVSNFIANYDCSVIEGNLVIGDNTYPYDNSNITDILNLASISSIEGNLYIGHNPSLLSLSGLENLTSVGGDLVIRYNTDLLNLTDLENLTSLGGSLSIQDNASLLNLMGLNGLTSVEGGLTIRNNTSLVNLTGLSNISSVENNLWIDKNASLLSLTGLEGLISVGSCMFIETNASLLNLIGLESLTSVENNLWIDRNVSLLSLTGLESLDFVGWDLWIFDNTLLSNCCILPNIINGVQGNVDISDNAFGCNSESEILSSCNVDKIQGYAFCDQNQNNLYDIDEPFLNQSFILQPDALYSFSTQNIGTNFYLDGYGDYTLFLNNSNPLWELNDGIANSIEISFFDSTFTDTLHYFPLQPIGEFTIQKIDLTSSITRCNQHTNYWLTYTNTGTTINDGYIQLIPDEITNFISANPMPDSTAGDTLYWYYEDLFPTHSEQIHLLYEMPDVDEIGEQIGFEAEIQTWDGLGDDKAILSSELICAYDPNDKLVTPSGIGEENLTLFGTTLEYTIRFQNTGNDTAFNVVVRDTFDVGLRMSSFHLIGHSHPIETIIDINTREVIFTFNDIYLPDSFVNEPASHGFIKFKMQAEENLAEGTPIENTAGIFFDSNPPIITNTTFNTLVSVIPGPAVLAISPGFVDFGELLMEEGLSVSENLTITNNGGAALEIYDYQIDSPNFSVLETDTLIVPSQSLFDFTVSFHPQSIGEFNNTLTLISNVGTLPISLKGTALDPTGIPHLSNSDFQIYPNPNQGQFVLKTNNETSFSYKIYNSLGQLIVEQKSANNNEVINLAEAGLYVVMVETEDGVWVEKVVVE